MLPFEGSWEDGISHSGVVSVSEVFSYSVFIDVRLKLIKRRDAAVCGDQSPGVREDQPFHDLFCGDDEVFGGPSCVYVEVQLSSSDFVSDVVEAVVPGPESDICVPLLSMGWRPSECSFES